MNRRFAHLALCVGISVFLTTTALAGTIIHVPAQQPTIQAGINAANNGDTVLVAPGTYFENINFGGKQITVMSSGGAKATIIDGGNLAPVVTFSSAETAKSVLSGFTLQHGTATFGSGYEGGGIIIGSASPTIKNNIIQSNTACSAGGGIALGFASPLIEGNIIQNNSQSGCSGGVGGGGISVRGASSAQIIGNVIQNNSWFSSEGGGISLFAAGYPVIKNNVIKGNSSGSGGGAISMSNLSDAVVVQNIIEGNTAPDGGGIYYLVPSGANGPILVSNTFTGNQSSSGNGSAIYANDYNVASRLFDNIITGVGGEVAVYCGNLNSTTPPSFFSNDVYAPLGTPYGGICTDQTGSNGNISADPQFTSKGNLRLKDGSPAIDAGDNSAPDLPAKDFANNPRIINGNGGSTAIVDIGAYEFVPVVLAPKSLSFGLHTVGSSTSKTIKLTNAQNKVLNVSSYSVPTGYSVTGCGTSVAAFASCTLTVTFNPLTSGTFKGMLSVKDDAGNSPQTVTLSGSAQ